MGYENILTPFFYHYHIILYITVFKSNRSCEQSGREGYHQRKRQEARPILPPFTVQIIVPPRRKKSEHTRDSFLGKWPIIVPDFFTATAYRSRPLWGSLSDISSCLPYFFIHLEATNAANSFKLLHASFSSATC